MAKKTIKSSDVLGNNYYIYELSSSNYTPALNGTITITCTVTDVYGDPIGSKSITLYKNGTSVSTKTTNSSGIATWSITCWDVGIQSFKVGNKAIEVFVDNKEDKNNKITSLNGLTESDTHYPSSLLVLNYLDTKEDITNKVTSIGSSSTDDEYPSALCVYDAIDNEATRISNIEDSINDLGNMAFRDTLAEVAGSSDIIDILEQDGYSLFSGDYDDLDNKPTIPSKTSQLTNDSGFLTSHQSLDSKTVTVEKLATATSGYLSSYVVKQNGVQVGNTINIPKDFLVKSGSVKTVSTANNPVSGYSVGDKYIDLVINVQEGTSTDSHIYILVSDLIDTPVAISDVTGLQSALDTKYSKNNIVTISSTNTVDLDNYTTSDFYIFAPINMLQYVSNAPNDLDDSVFYLLVEKRDVNYVKQTLTSKMGVTWVRTKISNTGWNRWREQQSGGNINSGVNLLGQWSSYSNCSTTPVRTYSLYHSEPIDQIINSGVSDTTKYTDFLWIIRSTDFSYDDVFTLSFYAKGTNAKNFKTYFYGGSGYIGVKRISSNSTVSNSIGISSSFGDGATEFTLGSDWQKYYVTYKLNSSGTASVDKKITIRIFGGTDFYLNSPKLERGYDATDYTPSNNVRNINYNIDFNDYKSEGHYWIWSSEQTSNTNAPDTQGGLLIVYNIPNGCIQLLYQYWSPEAKIYYRIYHTSAGWRDWQTLSVDGHTHNSTDIKSVKIPSGDDLNDYVVTGFYYNNSNIEAQNITNIPESGKAFFLLVEDWGASNYTKQTITHYYTGKTYTRIRNQGTWGNWKQLLNYSNFESTSSNIKMNGTASVGSLDTVARADHIHPSDTSKVNVSSIVDNLTSTTTNVPLSANQGKVLNDGKANKSEVVDVNNIVFVDKTDDDTGAIILNFLT